MMTYRPKLIDGDCREELKKIPDGSVDLVLTDPPYGISNPDAGEIVRNGGKYGHAKSIKADFGEWDHPENAPQLEDWVPECVRVLKPTGIFISFYGNNKLQTMIEYLQSLGMHFRQFGVWVKTNPSPQARGVKWQDAIEIFVIATKNTGTGHHFAYKEGQRLNAIISPICMGAERFEHPTQKTEHVAREILRWWSFPGDMILDPFMGTGTFPYIAMRMGRTAVGIEKDPKYFEIAARRCGILESSLDKFQGPLDKL